MNRCRWIAGVITEKEETRIKVLLDQETFDPPIVYNREMDWMPVDEWHELKERITGKERPKSRPKVPKEKRCRAEEQGEEEDTEGEHKAKIAKGNEEAQAAAEIQASKKPASQTGKGSQQEQTACGTWQLHQDVWVWLESEGGRQKRWAAGKVTQCSPNRVVIGFQAKDGTQ